MKTFGNISKILVLFVAFGFLQLTSKAASKLADIPAGLNPAAVAVDATRNKIFVANSSGGSLTVIDGATNSVTNLDLQGIQARSIAVNLVTNKIFVAGGNSLDSIMIDGATNAVTEFSLGVVSAFNVEVNFNTNKIYFSHGTSNRISVVDGATLAATSFPSNAGLTAVQQIKVNPTDNKIYFLHPNGIIMEYDEPTGTQKTISAGTVTPSFDLDTLNGKIYLADRQTTNAFIITKQNRQNVSPATTIAPLAGNTTNLPTPVFNLAAASLAEKAGKEEGEPSSQINSLETAQISATQQIYYQVDKQTGNWRKAVNGNAPLPPLATGLHTLYAFTADGQDSTTTNTGEASSPLVGKTSAYLFRVVPFSGTQNNNNQITIPNAGGAASPYPSVLNVANVPGVIEKITVKLNQVSHGFPDNLDILLVSPSGEKMILMSDAGGADFALSLTNLTFDDAAPARLPDDDFIADGTYKPSNFIGGSDTFPAPAPPAPYANPGTENFGAATLNGTFGGISPNGAWKLFVVDDVGASSGSIQGWNLTFQTTTNCPASSYAISPQSVNLGPAGGTGSISVNAPFGCIWNAIDNSNFISFSSALNGIGSGTIDFTVASSNQPRTGTATIGGQTFTVIQQFPTAASVAIGGRILTPEGRSLKNALVTLTATNGGSQTALTNAFGYYRFADVSVGETYIISVISKRYQFEAQAILINEERDDINLRAQK